jgi:hypothetical protein
MNTRFLEKTSKFRMVNRHIPLFRMVEKKNEKKKLMKVLVVVVDE